MEPSEYSARLSAIVLSSEDAILSKNLDGIITSWNPSSEIIFGFTAAEAIGKHISLIIPEELLGEEDTIISGIKRGERIHHFETIRKRKDGSCFPVAITVSPIRDDAEQITGASTIARDITEQNASDRTAAMLAAIVNSSDDAIVSKNLDGIIKSWNKGAETIFGFTAEEAIERSIFIIIPEYKLEEELDILRKIRAGERISHFETVRKRKDGREINISVTISPIKDRSGKIIGASKIARDITEKAELEQQRKLYLKRLQDLNNYKDQFMVIVSHELKTPLTVIKGNLELLEYDMQEDEQKLVLVKRAMTHVDKLTNLIVDLLDVSKIQSGRLELKMTTFDLTEFLTEIINSIQQTSASHTIAFNHSKEKLTICADVERLEQVVINLLTNAIKYSPDAKLVTVNADVRQNQVIITVKDEGIGIAPEDMDKIFTRFFRVQGLSSNFPGSGVGLYISSEIVKQHGGDIWAESELNKGSTFYFTIPVIEPA